MTLLTAQQCNMLLLLKHFDIPYLYTHRGSPWKHPCNNLPSCLLCCHGSHPRIVLFSLPLPRVYDSQPAGETTIQPVSHDVPPLHFLLEQLDLKEGNSMKTQKMWLWRPQWLKPFKGGMGQDFLLQRVSSIALKQSVNKTRIQRNKTVNKGSYLPFGLHHINYYGKNLCTYSKTLSVIIMILLSLEVTYIHR